MTDWLPNLWHRSERHLSEEDAVLLLDGELAPRKQVWAQKHLAECWTCRTQLHRLENAVRAFIEQRDRDCDGARDDLDLLASRFSARLTEKTSPERQRRLPPARSILRWASVAAGVMLASILVVRIGREPLPRVSANEVVARSEARQATEIAPLLRGAVVRRDLRVRRKRAGHDEWQEEQVSALIDSARARLSAPAGAGIWSSLEHTLSSNGLDEPWPLSIAGFRKWRQSLRDAAEEVVPVRLHDGQAGWKLRVTPLGAIAPGSVRSVELLVGASDWGVRQQAIEVATAAGSDAYEISGGEFQIVAAVRRSTPPALPTIAPPALRRMPAEPPTTPPAVVIVDPNRVQAEAFLALHRLDACRLDAIEVNRTDDSVEVTGVVETVRRRQEIVEELSRVAGLRVRILAAEEVSASGLVPSRRETPDARLVPAPLPLQALLEGYFLRQFGPAAAPMEIARFADRAVRIAASARTEAAAISALARAFPGPRLTGLDAAAGPITAIVQEHLHHLREDVDLLRWLLAPIEPDRSMSDAAATSRSPSTSFEECAARLWSSVSSADRFTGVLFAGLDPQGLPTGTVWTRLREELTLQLDLIHQLGQSTDQLRAAAETRRE